MLSALQVLRKLVRVGVNIARFNAAHGTVQTHLASLAKLRKWVHGLALYRCSGVIAVCVRAKRYLIIWASTYTGGG